MSRNREEEEMLVPEQLGIWLENILARMSVGPSKTWTFEEFQKEYTKAGLGDFRIFWQGEIVEELRELGLLVL
jgi:hypothetical protein